MSLPLTSAKHYSQLQPEDRVTLASLRQQNYSISACIDAVRPGLQSSCM